MSEPDTGSYDVPKWFVALAIAFMVAAGPWAAWMTRGIYSIESRLNTLTDVSARVEADASRRFQDIERRLDRLEAMKRQP